MPARQDVQARAGYAALTVLTAPPLVIVKVADPADTELDRLLSAAAPILPAAIAPKSFVPNGDAADTVTGPVEALRAVR